MRMLIAVVLMVLAGCASNGRDFKEENLGQLRVGETTVAEAGVLLGAKPTQTINRADGKVGVVWQYVSTTAFTGTDIKQAVLLFDEQGRFLRVVQTIEQ